MRTGRADVTGSMPWISWLHKERYSSEIELQESSKPITRFLILPPALSKWGVALTRLASSYDVAARCGEQPCRSGDLHPRLSDLRLDPVYVYLLEIAVMNLSMSL